MNLVTFLRPTWQKMLIFLAIVVIATPFMIGDFDLFKVLAFPGYVIAYLLACLIHLPFNKKSVGEADQLPKSKPFEKGMLIATFVFSLLLATSLLDPFFSPGTKDVIELPFMILTFPTIVFWFPLQWLADVLDIRGGGELVFVIYLSIPLAGIVFGAVIGWLTGKILSVKKLRN